MNPGEPLYPGPSLLSCGSSRGGLYTGNFLELALCKSVTQVFRGGFLSYLDLPQIVVAAHVSVLKNGEESLFILQCICLLFVAGLSLHDRIRKSPGFPGQSSTCTAV